MRNRIEFVSVGWLLQTYHVMRDFIETLPKKQPKEKIFAKKDNLYCQKENNSQNISQKALPWLIFIGFC